MNTGRIHWSLATSAGTEQHAWTDVSHYIAPYTGKFDLCKMQQAVSNRFPRQSSYGALHWLSGVSVAPDSSELNGKGGTVKISFTYGIAD